MILKILEQDGCIMTTQEKIQELQVAAMRETKNRRLYEKKNDDFWRIRNWFPFQGRFPRARLQLFFSRGREKNGETPLRVL